LNIRSCPTAPIAKKSPTDTKVFGTKVQDDYRWLETDGAERDGWLKGQMSQTDCKLDSYPNHGAIKERLVEAFKSQKAAFQGDMQKGEGYSVQWSREAGAQYLRLTKFEDGSTDGEVVFDPADWPKGETLGWTTISPDKKFLAYGRVINGMDVGRMEIMDLKSGKIVRTLDGQDAQDPPTWAGNDDKLYFSAKEGYSGFLGYDISDDAITQKASGWLAPYGDIAEHDGNLLYTTNAPTYLDEEAIFINKNGVEMKTDIPVGRMSFSHRGNHLFINTTAEAPNGKVLMVDLTETIEGAPPSRVLIPETPGRNITGVTALENAVAVSYSEKYMPGLAIYDLDGNIVHEIPFGDPGYLSGVGADDDGNLEFTWSTPVQPAITKKFDTKTGELSVVKEQKIPGFNPEDFKVERRWYKSADGTEVPMTLAYKNDVEKDGENPAHIYVYGGFRSAVDPYFSATRIPFLEAGGVYAIAHVRGGDELGEEWHSQATGLNRTKVYDDVAGAARFLAEAGYSSAEHLSIEGASNGGLVAGVAVTRNPELFDAAISEVGLHDMVRYEELGGRSWNQEYGSITNEQEAHGLLSWSPYHNIRKGVKYPAVMVTTGKHDDRVDPAHSFKFAAKMQEVDSPERPVYLRVEENLGHGHGATDEQWADRYADQWAFLLSELTDDDSKDKAEAA
jgi:prolyl oligopeptidase